MSVKNNTQDRLDNLEHLSQYAGYLLDKFSVEFASLLLRFSQEANLPVLKLLTHLTQEQLQELTIQNTTELLEALHGNKGRRLIEDTLQRFVSNRLPNIDNHTIVTEDILLSATARRQVFLHFLPDYASSIIQAVDVIRDLDVYMLYSQTALTNAHANLLQQKIEESSRFIQSVNTTLPGAVYIFDPKTFQNVYATPKLESVIGYTVAELNAFSRAASNEIVHEEDQGEMNDHLANVMKCADGEIYSYKYRVKLKTGAYRWIRNYETPFQRDSEGKVTQTIAIALNIDKEKRTAEDLKHREADLVAAQQLFNQAQALSHFGHYSMNLETREIVFTEEASRIYGFDSKRSVFQYEEIVSLIEPEDKDKVRQALWQTIATREPFDYHFRITNHKGENKTLHSLGTIVNTEGDNSGNLVGTVQDVTERHGLLRQLLESEKLYKQAQALAHLGNWTLDFRTGEYILSDEMYRIYERSPGEPFLSNDWQDFIHPEDRDEVLHYLNETSSRNEPYDKIHRILLKNGKVKTLLRKGTVVFDDQGKPVKMVGTTQDVTAQHKIQEELKDNQTFIRKITDATPSIIGSYNVHSGKYVFISEGLEKLLGYKTADVSQKGALFFSQIIHPDDMEKVKRVNEEAIQQANANQGNNDLVIETIYRLRHCNGHYRWFHTYGTIFDRNKQGQVEHFLNITLDVTAQIVAEEKIADQELFIQRVADASPTILYIFTVSSNSFEYINKELFFVLGYTTEEVENMGDNVVETLYHPEDINQLPERKESTKKFQHRNSMIQYECRIRSKEGDWKWLLVREVIFKTTEDGKAAQVLGAALDITKRKEMERSLLQNSFHLEQSNASLEEFAYVASHDLKEPLRKISTFGDRIVSTQLDKLTPEGKMYLTKIVDASQRMQVMINDLLSISLISGDRSFQKFSLQAVLEDAKQALEYKIEQKNAVIEGVRLPQASIVPSQFRQLFQNLLSNSLKFVSDNRVPLIRVEACYIPAEEVKEFQMVMAPQYLKLTFEDNGIGFEEEYSGKIFQIFQRLHGKSEYEGTGIGLAICKKIVEHHGGVIYATGMPEQGAVFTIILPA